MRVLSARKASKLSNLLPALLYYLLYCCFTAASLPALAGAAQEGLAYMCALSALQLVREFVSEGSKP